MSEKKFKESVVLLDQEFKMNKKLAQEIMNAPPAPLYPDIKNPPSDSFRKALDAKTNLAKAGIFINGGKSVEYIVAIYEALLEKKLVK